MSEDIFRHSDRSLAVIMRELAREFQNIGTQLGFDKLNVLSTHKDVNAMYARLNTVIVREFRAICRKAYRDACLEANYHNGTIDPDKFVDSLLHDYNTLTEFVYVREWIRKRDRLFESIIATEQGNQDMRRNLKRGLDVLARQVRQYADIVTIQSRLKAFKDAGIDALVWITEKDEKVCPVCRPRDEQIYPIEMLPDWPAHWNCRCTLQIVDMEEWPNTRRKRNGFKQYTPA